MTRLRIGIAVLIAGYGLSQFYRAFLAVMTDRLAIDLDAGTGALAQASSMWFLTFAVMQIPVGIAFDRIGPRWTTAGLLAGAGGGGAMVFALAQSPMQVVLAMGLIGIGCAPVLMAAFYVIARSFSPAMFATLTGMVIGLGSLGNLAAAAPMVWAIEALGWRSAVWVMAAVTLIIAGLIAALLRDPPRLSQAAGGSALTILAMPALWPILAVMFVTYAPAAAIRGFWVGPYADMGLLLDPAGVGRVTLAMGLAMIAGSFAFGPLERAFATRKWVIVWGNAAAVLACGLLFLWPEQHPVLATFLFCIIGFAGASFPLIVAHARAFIPAHLTGRGVTLVNMFGIGGVGLSQLAAAAVFDFNERFQKSIESYGLVFGFFGLFLLLGSLAYLWARDRTD